MLVAEQRVPRRPVVVADELVSRRRDQSPLRIARRLKVHHDVVIAPQEARRADEMLLVENTIGHGILTTAERLAGDVREDLAALRVDAEDAWRLEVSVLEIAQQRIHRRCPGTRAATDGVADADSLVEIATEENFFAHALKAKPDGWLLRRGFLSRGDRSKFGAGGRDEVGAGVRMPVDAPTAFGRLSEEDPRALGELRLAGGRRDDVRQFLDNTELLVAIKSADRCEDLHPHVAAVTRDVGQRVGRQVVDER